MKLNPPVTIHELPIPEDVQPTRLWPGQMLEMAAHIGPYATLVLVDRLGGQSILIPKDPARNRLVEVIGPEKTEIVSRIYGGEFLAIPMGTPALNEARRGPVIAAIRAGKLTIQAAVPILRLKRSTISNLVNHTDEGTGAVQAIALPSPRRDARQLDMFSE